MAFQEGDIVRDRQWPREGRVKTIGAWYSVLWNGDASASCPHYEDELALVLANPAARLLNEENQRLFLLAVYWLKDMVTYTRASPEDILAALQKLYQDSQKK